MEFCGPDYSKKLHQAGIKPQTPYRWEISGDKEPAFVLLPSWERIVITILTLGIIRYQAGYSEKEIKALLPKTIFRDNRHAKLSVIWAENTEKEHSWVVDYEGTITSYGMIGEGVSNVLAEMLLSLIKYNGYKVR